MSPLPKNREIETVDDAIAAVLRDKTPAQRVAMIGDAHETARALVAAGVRCRHPDWSEQQVSAEVARSMLGDST